jgi:molybdate transport system substrate-binding protein
MHVLTRILALVFTVLGLSGCVHSNDVIALDVASSLSVMSEDLTQSAAEQTGLGVQLTSAGTATLVQQISEGKHSDILLSADDTSLNELEKNKLIWGEPIPVAKNSLVLAVASENTKVITSLDDLERSNVKVAQCAEQVPCGKLAQQVIRQHELDYVPLTETPDVSGAVKLVLSGDADAAFVYATDVQASGGKLSVVSDSRMSGFDAVITGVVIGQSRHREQSQQLLNLWASPAFAQVWESAGFIPVRHTP